MKVNRKKALDAFKNYTEAYDTGDEKVRLKIEHTYRVSGLCEAIARSLELAEEDVDLAWLTGLLHDVGRFEQLKNYGTFIDEQSIDHAAYGAELLFQEGKIRDYAEDASEDALIRTAVMYHSAYRAPELLDERTERFCHILRDADKIDILKVNVDFPLEEIYNVTESELRDSRITQEVMKCFEEEHAVLKSLKKSAADHVVGHISLAYELVYPASLAIVREQGCLDRLMDFPSRNPETVKQFEKIRERMTRYMRGKTGSKQDTREKELGLQ